MSCMGMREMIFRGPSRKSHWLALALPELLLKKEQLRPYYDVSH